MDGLGKLIANLANNITTPEGRERWLPESARPTRGLYLEHEGRTCDLKFREVVFFSRIKYRNRAAKMSEA